MRANHAALYRLFSVKQRALWREDEEVVTLRRAYARSRDRAARWRRRVRQMLEEAEPWTEG